MHLILIIITHRCPRIFTSFHAPVLLLLNLSSIIQISVNPTSKNSLAGNIIGLCFFLTAGLLTNARWVYTTPAMIITTVGKVSFYYVELGIRDYTVMI